MDRNFDVVEVKRGYLRFSDKVDLTKIKVLLRDKKIDEVDRSIVLSGPEADAFVEDLRRRGFNVYSIRDRIAELAKPKKVSPSPTTFGEYKFTQGIENPASFEWSTYSFATRRLTPVKLKTFRNGHCGFFAREGQIFRAWLRDFCAGHFIAENGKLNKISDPQIFLVEAHSISSPAQVFYEFSGGYFVKLYKTPIWLPPVHYDLLYNCLPVKDIGESENYILIYNSDLGLVEQIIGSLFIKLKEGKKPAPDTKLIEIMYIISELFKESYSEYLKNQNRVEEFCSVVRTCSWEKIRSPVLKNIFSKLSSDAFGIDAVALEIFNYIEKKVGVAIDWKTLREAGFDTEVLGVVSESGENYFRGDYASNYYKVIIPDLEMALGWQTTQPILTRGQKFYYPLTFLIDQWRAYPFLGRIKTTPYTQLVKARAKKDEIKQSKIVLLGIPSVEKILLEKLYLSSFCLDLNPQHWKGQYELSRNFTGYGKIVDLFSREFDDPTSLMEDVLGQRFFVRWDKETYERNLKELKSQRLASWKYFFAQNRVFENINLKSPLPIFFIVPGTIFQEVGFRRVVHDTVLAMIKYNQWLSINDIKEQLKVHMPEEFVEETISASVGESTVGEWRGKLFYRYQILPIEKLKAFLEFMTDRDTKRGENNKNFYFPQEILSKYLPVIHPLRFGFSLVEPKEEKFLDFELKYLRRFRPRKVIIQSNEKEEHIKRVLENIQKGATIVSARGHWIPLSREIVGEIVKESDENFTLLRKDTELAHEGRRVKQVEYKIISRGKVWLNILKKRFGR